MSLGLLYMHICMMNVLAVVKLACERFDIIMRSVCVLDTSSSSIKRSLSSSTPR